MKKIALIAGIVIVVVLSFFYVQKKNIENKAVQEDLLTPSFREEKIPETDSIKEDLLGKWQSTQDPRFMRSFTEVTVVDSYAGVEEDSGTWSVTADKDGVYITMIFSSGPLEFKISDIDEANLEMIYLDRGNALSFRRAPELE